MNSEMILLLHIFTFTEEANIRTLAQSNYPCLVEIFFHTNQLYIQLTKYLYIDLFHVFTGTSPMPPKLVRPILPRERSAIDKVVEYLVGDGPQHRYALICRHCSSHNGMAFKEEFEYLSKYRVLVSTVEPL